MGRIVFVIFWLWSSFSISSGFELSKDKPAYFLLLREDFKGKKTKSVSPFIRGARKALSNELAYLSETQSTFQLTSMTGLLKYKYFLFNLGSFTPEMIQDELKNQETPLHLFASEIQRDFEKRQRGSFNEKGEFVDSTIFFRESNDPWKDQNQSEHEFSILIDFQKLSKLLENEEATKILATLENGKRESSANGPENEKGSQGQSQEPLSFKEKMEEEKKRKALEESLKENKPSDGVLVGVSLTIYIVIVAFLSWSLFQRVNKKKAIIYPASRTQGQIETDELAEEILKEMKKTRKLKLN